VKTVRVEEEEMARMKVVPAEPPQCG